MFIRLGLSVLLVGAGLAGTALAEADPEKGSNLAKTKCAHCHGSDGNARSTKFQPVPMLAGQPAIYLVQEMRNYASGTREDRSRRSTMSKALSSLNEKDFEDIAAYYAAQKRY